MTMNQELDVFDTYFPQTLAESGQGEMRAQLLNQTRHRPRDMVMLFKRLQEHSGDGPLTGNQIFNAMAVYSREYLLPEIKDELDGYIDGELF